MGLDSPSEMAPTLQVSGFKESGELAQHEGEADPLGMAPTANVGYLRT